ncbi:signal peptidase II [Photobacterium aphoticum]|uniref:Lipoprotein signal peptidase n=1 Tax=Photobacterium aphoticum TaxID=754436 RepID=A0A090REN7_9GAMM|nr:signal peptidase II [Photobacterium aphoticum]KLV00758.1 hypothetical protein ABT58_11040 [Photobacterium aphoticum]PSU58252.1 lipoprotein signal peptidase [Photobacterium aphoticum]GAL06002.1 lipoprotein signal peptidase [Photobacterium aphoticum]GHA50946.1 lipoprotein signal peptidase [Photobacterium aphoticum]
MTKLSPENGIPVKQSGVRWLWLAALVFIVDIASKFLVMHNMDYGWPNRIELLPFFNLLYVHNYGAAFSFLSDAGGWQRWLFTAIALGVCGMLTYWMRKLPASHKLANVSYALIIGGALGNLFDRMYHGFVVDFLDFYVGDYHWPAFNIADTAICIGAALIILEGFLSDRKKQTVNH